MLTYQDYEKHIQTGGTQDGFLKQALNEYKKSFLYKTACIADTYDKQKNITVNQYVKYLYRSNGSTFEDFTASNNKIASNFFNRLNTQRCTYLLGNGIEFSKKEIKANFGKKFDTTLQEAGYNSLIHGVSYLYYSGRLFCFKATEIVPLYDEYTGVLMAAIRFWQIDEDKPLTVVFYEADGYTEYTENSEKELTVNKEKRAYIVRTQYTEAFGEEIVGSENYSALPIVPLWGSRLKQSTLVGMRAAIDSYDLIRSHFANDLADCAQIYWLLEGYGGSDENDLKEFRERLLFNHIAAVSDGSEDVRITPYTQEIPYEARQKYLEAIRAEIYEGFGGLDVHAIAAGATNDHIDAAYQPLDENADDFEKQIVEAIQAIGELLGIDSKEATPLFKRNRISNQAEQVEMVLQAAQYLDSETVLKHLPFLTTDEIEGVIKRLAAEEQTKLVDLQAELEEIRAAQRENEGDSSEGLTDG